MSDECSNSDRNHVLSYELRIVVKSALSAKQRAAIKRDVEAMIGDEVYTHFIACEVQDAEEDKTEGWFDA